MISETVSAPVQASRPCRAASTCSLGVAAIAEGAVAAWRAHSAASLEGAGPGPLLSTAMTTTCPLEAAALLR